MQHFSSTFQHFSLQAALGDGVEEETEVPRCLLILVTEHPMLVVSPRGLATLVTTETNEITRNTTGGQGEERSLSKVYICQHLVSILVSTYLFLLFIVINILLINRYLVSFPNLSFSAESDFWLLTIIVFIHVTPFIGKKGKTPESGLRNENPLHSPMLPSKRFILL